MGLLSTPKLAPDERLVVGAYVRKGLSLYRVTSHSASQMVLEDAYLSNARDRHVKATTISDVLTHYTLVRKA